MTIKRHTGINFSDQKDTAEYKCQKCGKFQILENVKKALTLNCVSCKKQTWIEEG